jgi:hypothetical protein
MPLNDLHIQIATAYPDLKPVASGKGKTLLGDISTGREIKKAFIKLLSVEDIAKEALCAVLARKLHLPVQQPYYVSMINTEFDGHGNMESVAFGLLYDLTPSFRLNNIQGVETELYNWPDLLRSAVFDEWIANRDRIPNNMVFEKNGLFWLYDHDEAFPSYVSVSTPVNPQLLAINAKNRSEFELYKIREDAMKIVDEYMEINWDEIYELLRIDEISGAKNYFMKYINFLRARLPEMRNILTQDLGIKQAEFAFKKLTEEPKESES